MSDQMSQHYVTFYSPGTLFSEESRCPIDNWDVDAAVEMARTVKERYGAVPYGFRFTTRSRGPADLDAKQTARSPFYWLGGTVRTLAEVEAENNPKEKILIGNMRRNNYGRVIVNTNSWLFTAPLGDEDVILPFTLDKDGSSPEERL